MRKLTAGLPINPPYYQGEQGQAVMAPLAAADPHLYGRRAGAAQAPRIQAARPRALSPIS
jgi:hypothetical protein